MIIEEAISAFFQLSPASLILLTDSVAKPFRLTFAFDAAVFGGLIWVANDADSLRMID